MNAILLAASLLGADYKLIAFVDDTPPAVSVVVQAAPVEQDEYEIRTRMECRNGRCYPVRERVLVRRAASAVVSDATAPARVVASSVASRTAGGCSGTVSVQSRGCAGGNHFAGGCSGSVAVSRGCAGGQSVSRTCAGGGVSVVVSTPVAVNRGCVCGDDCVCTADDHCGCFAAARQTVFGATRHRRRLFGR